MNDELASAVALLRSAGWTVIPPTESLSRCAVGQVWQSPRPGEEVRTVVRIGRHRWYPPAGNRVVFFTTPSLEVGQESASPEIAFLAWADKSGARPITQGA